MCSSRPDSPCGRVRRLNTALGITRVRVAVICLLALASAQASTPPTLSATDQAALLKAASELRAAVVAKDIETILKHVSTSGIGCTDTLYPRQKVETDLRSKDGYLHRSLFDTARFANECGSMYPSESPWISDRDFFLADKEAKMEVKVHAANEAQVVFRSKVPKHYPREYDFQKEGGSWRLTYGVILGGCSCG